MICNADYRYFEKARQTALISDFHKIHVGCVVVYQGNIIGIGCNCNKTHPMQKRGYKYWIYTNIIKFPFKYDTDLFTENVYLCEKMGIAYKKTLNIIGK